MKKLIMILFLLITISACTQTSDVTASMNNFQKKYEDTKQSYEYVEKNLTGALAKYTFENEEKYYDDSLNNKSYENNTYLKVNYIGSTNETKVEYKQGQRDIYSFTYTYTIDSNNKVSQQDVTLLSNKEGDTTTEQNVIDNFTLTKEEINEKIKIQIEPVYTSLSVSEGTINSNNESYTRSITTSNQKGEEQIILTLTKDSSEGNAIYSGPELYKSGKLKLIN